MNQFMKTKPKHLPNHLKPSMKKIPSGLLFSKQAVALVKASALSCTLLLFSGITSFAQCGKDVILTSSKTEYVDTKGSVQRTVAEDSVIQVVKSEVTISPGGRDKMTGTVTSTACEWKQPFKEGKSTLEARFKNDNGEVRNATITIEGKAGKITFSLQEKERPDRIIRVTIDKFEEQK
jgi:molybdopterin-binding protein